MFSKIKWVRNHYVRQRWVIRTVAWVCLKGERKRAGNFLKMSHEIPWVVSKIRNGGGNSAVNWMAMNSNRRRSNREENKCQQLHWENWFIEEEMKTEKTIFPPAVSCFPWYMQHVLVLLHFSWFYWKFSWEGAQGFCFWEILSVARWQEKP